MTIYHIAINNMRRRKGKLVFLIIGLVIGVSTVIALVTLSEAMNTDVAKKLDEYGANIVIVPKSEGLSLTYGGMTVGSLAYDMRQLHMRDIDAIRTINNHESISTIAPKLLNRAKVDGSDMLVVGVQFDQESRLKKWWRIEGRLPQRADEILVGNDVREKHHFMLGQRVRIAEASVVIAGFLESTGSQDDGVIFMELKHSQELFRKSDEISMIELAALCYDCPIEAIVTQVTAALPVAKVTPIRQVIDSKMEMMHRFQMFSYGISIVMVCIGGLILFTTMMASINERKREIGVFRAIGYRQWHIIQIMCVEASLTCSLSGMIGYVAGYLTAEAAAPILTMGERLALSIDYRLFGLAVVSSILIGILSSVYPAVKAARMNPTIALRAL